MMKYIWILPFFCFGYGWNATGYWHGGIGTGLIGVLIASIAWYLHQKKRKA